ncbi:MAG: hypothetical protein AAGA80_26930 [Cyanobacteria bacterium P01_F01_bin.143]
MHSIKIPRYAVILILIWLLLIISFFFDPLTPTWTDQSNLISPFRPKSLETCLFFQGECLPYSPYALGARLFWGIVIPIAVVCLLLFGSRFWRQVCPLAWIIQLPRLLGWQSKRRRIINHDHWLVINSPYITFFLFFLGLNIRLLFINSDRLGLGIVLLLISLAALTSGFWFSGRTWCQYFCPMIAVETIYLGTEGALGNPLQRKPSKLPTRLCQTIDPHGKPKSACVGCSSPCIDLDETRFYWQQILHPGRKWSYYGYFGLVIGFFGYFPLYSGNSQFLESGTVWLETHQLKTLFQPGFYLFNQAIAIPKILAVPLTLSISVLFGFLVGSFFEKLYKQLLKSKQLSEVTLQHHCFSFCTFVSFNLLFFMGVQPSLGWLPVDLVKIVSWLLLIVSVVWLYRALKRPVPKRFQKRKQKEHANQNRQKSRLAATIALRAGK